MEKHFKLSETAKLACMMDPSMLDIFDEYEFSKFLCSVVNGDEEQAATSTATAQPVQNNNGTAIALMPGEQPSKKMKLVQKIRPLSCHACATNIAKQIEDEIKRYQKHLPNAEEAEKSLLFWKQNGHMYPNLSLLAKEYLGIPSHVYHYGAHHE